MKPILIIPAVFVVFFIIILVKEIVATVRLFIETSRFKKTILANGYPKDALSGILVPTISQFKNTWDTVGYSTFSVESYAISRFGKGILDLRDDERYKTAFDHLKKAYENYIKFGIILFVSLWVTILAIIIGVSFI